MNFKERDMNIFLFRLFVRLHGLLGQAFYVQAINVWYGEISRIF